MATNPRSVHSSTPAPGEHQAARARDAKRSRAGAGVELAIRQRATLLRELRSFFDSRGFLEIQAPCLLPDCVVDAYLDPIQVEARQLRLGGWGDRPLYLQTSPELAMKQMLAAGAPSIYSLGPVFRAGESGPQHRVEFTMLEWYEVGGDQRSAIELLGGLAIQILGLERYEVRDYRQLFRDELGIDPIEGSLEALQREVRAISAEVAESLEGDRDGLLDVLVSLRLQPSWGWDCPLIVNNYPLSQGALARRSREDPSCAARFELFVDGVELANGYDELLDADEWVARAERNNARRVAGGREPLPVESSLVAAMRAGLPASAGVALGVDRLQMVLNGRRDLQGCGVDGLQLDRE